MIVPVNVLPFSWVLLRPCCHARPGSARRVALGMGWADTASACSSNLFFSWVEYHLLQLLGVDGIDDLSDISACDGGSKGKVQFEQTLLGRAREVGSAVVWMGSGLNSPKGGMKVLLFSSPCHK